MDNLPNGLDKQDIDHIFGYDDELEDEEYEYGEEHEEEYDKYDYEERKEAELERDLNWESDYDCDYDY